MGPRIERKVLDWLESHEIGDWATSDAIVQSNSLNRNQMILHYSQAVVWADAALASAAALQAESGYKLNGRYPLPGTGGWDYVSIDSAARRNRHGLGRPNDDGRTPSYSA